jgi:acyl-[acyl-carrier-protein]-phospholipid O-acyltransferase/long-chain-fatty-acid--[acyl-carrier-protein] ligase
VLLSHNNLISNVDQVTSLVPILPSDKVFNALPMFHSFGLTGGTLMPILKGAQTMLYPSPLHYKVIPELIYDQASTILFGTPTFLAGYARKGHPYDLHSLRYVFSGAERLTDSVRSLYQEKFGIRVLEGYGTTETSPVIAVNTPFFTKRGSVGRLVPGVEYRLEAVEGIDSGGRLLVKGPNVMLGYFKIERPGLLEAPKDGWYDTGDLVTIDESGFVSIKGRIKRFAKIGGEMVSLTAIEQELEILYPETSKFAAISISDEKKGERLILITTLKNASRELISSQLRERGLPEIAIPKEVKIVKDLPLLGSGKVDIQLLMSSSLEEINAR